VQELTKQRYFYYIALMLMASTFLPLVFNNLPPVIRSHHIWTVIWGLSLIVFHPKIFMNKAILYLLFYGLILLLATETVWGNMDEWNYNILFNEYYQIAVGVSVVTYFLQTKDFINFARIGKWSLIFLFITAIMTIISATIDPLYARNINNVTAMVLETEKVLSFKRYGGGNYGTAAAFMCLFPLLIFYYKNIKISLLNKKQIIILSILIYFALLGMQIFANILVAMVFGVVALLGMKKIKHSIIIFGLFFCFLIYAPTSVYVKTLESISNLFEKNSELKNKINDMAIFLETGVDFENKNTETSIRAERYPILYESFIKSPFLGCYYLSDKSTNKYNIVGGHLYWMNKLTTTGIIGLIIFLIIPFNFIKNTLKNFNSTYKFYFILAILSILCYGLTKNISGKEAWYAFFIILPAMYYLPLLKKKQ
jgi:hypothetical protein